MLTITISTRAAALLLIAAAAAVALYATDALGSGDVPDEVLQGDINCDGAVDFQDGLGALQHEAGLPVDQNEPCFAPGSVAAIPGPPGPQGEHGVTGPPGPQGDQGAPGLSLWATVLGDGSLLGGTATGSIRTETGEFHVTFAEDVSDCAATASPGQGPPGATVFPLSIASIFRGTNDNTIRVLIHSPTGDRLPSAFNLIVAC